MQQCLSLPCAVARDSCHAGRNRHLVVGDGLTRNGLPLYQHVADAILSKSICPDGEHDFGAVYDLFYQVVPGTVVWQGNKIAVYDVGQRHHLLHKIAHRFITPVEGWATLLIPRQYRSKMLASPGLWISRGPMRSAPAYIVISECMAKSVR